MAQIISSIDALNAMADLDFFTVYNRNYRDIMINNDPYFGIEILSLFHDSTSLSNACAKYKSSVFLSINIQSLMSKHEQLVLELDELKQKNVTIDVIAIQETWDVKFPELVYIEGFSQLVF